ncbi:hypothetical protein D8B26_000997 [Coccidioides posadasii str. Silveira]|uniref:Uncharacterized protein n=1 Tax=Coccidioides posadasii (strain RMSCC 757 / Silveira) TaxID=443226 RepID=E9CUG2_COCPS|nr:conserved hypothetical protein [Coccidioides posadasii str. Silveira]QVM06285.1 hypothetical protein D8B26_000997 [Coccidioides posadasii str. Silveira]
MISSTLIATVACGAFASLVRAAPPQECCSILSKALPKNVFASGSSTWEFENKDYWSSTAVLDPNCVFLPDTTARVSEAVTLLGENECKFAVKGAGHSAIPGAANIHDGIMMSLAWLNSSDVHLEDNYIRVGAGQPLGNVFEALDPHNVGAVIGRFSKVGLGMGVGAGVSFFSNREGLMIDNILNYEVVIASGEVVNASATSNPDLFWALKGGNNNFGVVTHYDLSIFKTTGLYGGQVTYPETSLDQLADVIYDYHVHQAVDDVNTHALPQYAFDGNANETSATILVAYNDAVDELPEIMQPWLKVPHSKSTLKRRTYGDLATELNDGFPNGLVQEQRVFTVYADEQFYKDVWFKYRQWLQKYKDVPGFFGSHAKMPITPRQIEEGVKKGGNALGLEKGPQDKTLGIIYFGVTFNNPEDAPDVFPAHKEFVESMIEFAKSRKVLHPLIMLTFSAYDQPAIASYGDENVAKLHEVAKKYDPKGVFQRLVPGGQKLPAQ